MANPPLSYRRPGAVNASKVGLDSALKRREAAYQAAAWAMLATGVPAMFVLPFILATVATSLAWRNGFFDWSWHHYFALAAVIVIPLTVLVEMRSRGGWFEGEMRSQGNIWESSSYGEWEFRRAAAAWAAILEVALWGPRMALAAVERWKSPVSAAVLHESAAVISYLRRFDGGVPVADLPTEQMGTVLPYLMSRDWIDVSKDKKRVWLLSEARKLLT